MTYWNIRAVCVFVLYVVNISLFLFNFYILNSELLFPETILQGYTGNLSTKRLNLEDFVAFNRSFGAYNRKEV